MEFKRTSGILLHPTSLPGRFGIGDIGSSAYQFVDFLCEARQSLWQVLPLGHTGFGDSPYQSFSAFAGNPLLINLEQLAEWNFLTDDDLASAPVFPKTKVDFGQLIPWKHDLLSRAARRFSNQASDEWRESFSNFCSQNGWWLEDYALFISLKEAHEGAVWTKWEQGVALREPQALSSWRERLSDRMQAAKFKQFMFARQWRHLKQYANQNGIQIVGDIPIYVAHDSADVWANRPLFFLDEAGDSTVVAGVPPDYFSETGQLWGNPLYRWEEQRDRVFQWWTARVRETLKDVDIVRIDHFRGFESYWEVPASEETAINGRWVPGPGAAFFDHLGGELGDLPIIAENLGVITDEVEALRNHFELPGMAIIQFAFGSDATNTSLPHHYVRNLAAYTGTHDNDTIVGWLNGAGRDDSTRSVEEANREIEFARRYVKANGDEEQWDFIRAVTASVANIAVFPMQDVLGLGTEARMNQPGRATDNWLWRMDAEQFDSELASRLRELTELYGRHPQQNGDGD
ncbi:MAG: 4-alpha-glucanotransferase [bacterium]|nr:4-alpha-glucanotransferase [bacterium]